MRSNPRVVRQFVLYVALDVVCVGIGMGVPNLAILLGLAVGWQIIGLLDLAARPIDKALVQILRGAGITAGVTFVMMAVIWGRCIPMLFDPSADIANFGIPLLLYEPRASFVGWIVLMVLVSPFLQFLMTILGAHVALLRDERSGSRLRG